MLNRDPRPPGGRALVRIYPSLIGTGQGRRASTRIKRRLSLLQRSLTRLEAPGDEPRLTNTCQRGLSFAQLPRADEIRSAWTTAELTKYDGCFKSVRCCRRKTFRPVDFAKRIALSILNSGACAVWFQKTDSKSLAHRANSLNATE